MIIFILLAPFEFSWGGALKPIFSAEGLRDFFFVFHHPHVINGQPLGLNDTVAHDDVPMFTRFLPIRQQAHFEIVMGQEKARPDLLKILVP